VVHPLALLLWLAAVLAWLAGTPVLAGAIVGVIVINAGLAFWQEQQAKRSVEALAAYLPQQALVVRDGHPIMVSAEQIVPGDLLLVEEGSTISADARLPSGDVEVDMSALTGESVPVIRTAGASDPTAHLLHRPRHRLPRDVLNGQGRFATGAIRKSAGSPPCPGRLAIR
jgi:magnesium-transporting ATPase (P-type)